MDVINLGTEENKKDVKVGAGLNDEIKKIFVELLREYANVFAWLYQNMPGLDTNIVVHKPPLKHECPPIKQKLRRTRPDMSLKIRKEVRKKLDAGLLVVTKYP